MKRTALLLTIAACAALPASASASGKPSVAKAEQVTTAKVESRYRGLLEDYPEANVFVECRQRQVLKNERRYRCTWMVGLGYSGGFDGVESPSGNANTYWYKTKPWVVLL